MKAGNVLRSYLLRAVLSNSVVTSPIRIINRGVSLFAGYRQKVRKVKEYNALKIQSAKAKRDRKNANRYYCAYLAGDGYYWSRFHIKHYPEV